MKRKGTFQKILQYILALIVVVVVGYFFYDEFRKNWDAISTYDFDVNLYDVLISFVFMAFSSLLVTYIWQICVNDYLLKKLNFSESFVILNTSALLKYIPGKIWSYTAQIALMSSRGISKALLIYINLICFICFAIVSAIYTFSYYFFFLKVTPFGISILLFAMFIILDFTFIKWNAAVINRLINLINKLFKREIGPIKIKISLLVRVQLLYLVCLLSEGMCMYFLARGMGVSFSFSNIMAFTAIISVSSVIGYMVFISPGGLGVREGAMFVMLKQFSNIEAALILPIATRLVLIIIDVLLGVIGIWLGVKYRYFPMRAKRGKKQ